MATPWSMKLGSVNLTAGAVTAPARPTDETPFRIALLGNFSGHTGPPRALSTLRPALVDRDNFEEVLARLNVQVRLPGEAGSPLLTLRFRELDDFHPDRLFERLEAFRGLRDLRRRLSDPKTFAAAAAEVRGWAGAAAPAATPAAPPPLKPEDWLEQALGGTPGGREPAATLPGGEDWNAFLRRVVAPHLVPGTDPSQSELVARVDEATTAQMRAVLHHPDFQALEGAWRAVHLLVRRLDTDEGLKLYLLDATREELAADLHAAELPGSGLYRLLVEQSVGTAGGQPWALLVGDYTFGPTVEDALLLARLGMVAAGAGAPFVAGADSRLFGCPSVAQTPDPDDWKAAPDAQAGEVWQALRATPQAAYLGLVAPRFVVRMPYGEGAAATETFEFEELPAGTPHEGYLWGNPAFLCALLLGQGFNRFGWDLRPGEVLEVGSLPAHVYRAEGERRLKPASEAVLSDRAAGRMMDAGVMPLLAVQGTDRVRLARFQSLAAPATVLAARWES
jgi:type VI secretion system protein ImpC